ncbi:MAG: hypothetical protein JKY37_00735 [Nannocystaceae bacterium]|nr:hypothetical protein [Nannocystaceae bacterium]
MKRSRRFFIAALPAALVASRVFSVAAAPTRPGRVRIAPLRRKPKAKIRLYKLDAKQLRAAKRHNLHPGNVARAVSDTGLPPAEQHIQRALSAFKLKKPKKGKPTLDVVKFSEALHAKLGAKVTGYSWQLRRKGVATVSC